MLNKINWSELFPTKLSAVIFVSYMALFINQGIIVTASQSTNSAYSYNTVTVVLLTEVLKLIVSTVLYCKDHSVIQLVSEVQKNKKVLLLYFVPAFLYCLYNNLAFYSLSAFDPTTYYLLLQFRVVITGIVFQILFKKKLSAEQWLSLILLTIGCMIKQVDFSRFTSNEVSPSSSPSSKIGFHISINLLVIFIQTVCSCFAGVYNEYLLKGEGVDVNIYVQNVFMYLDSIVCSICVLIFKGDILEAFTLSSLSSVFVLKVVLIMVNNAAMGIIVSFFLKSLNSILKTFASALELMFTALLCWMIFGIPIYLNTIIAIGIVSYAVLLYSQNPVVNLPKSSDADKPEKEVLLNGKSVVENV